METTPTMYQSLLSARSRRLRTVGGVLLAAIIAMSLYGFVVLMPAINRSVAAHKIARIEASAPGSKAAPVLTPAQRKEQKKVYTQVAFVYAYWGVCGLLVIAALFIAWLDLREVSRNYLAQRRAIWNEVAMRSRGDRE